MTESLECQAKGFFTGDLDTVKALSRDVIVLRSIRYHCRKDWVRIKEVKWRD